MRELLSPAGSFDCAKAAAAAGADAVYMGGPLFSARAYAESSTGGADTGIVAGDPERDPLLKSLRYCHLRGVRVYMTVNTLMKDRELQGLRDWLRPYAENHVDAFIVQDPGLLYLLKDWYPEIPLHISTQAAVTGPRAAAAFLAAGAVRVVPARELSLPELRRIADTGIEVEAFIHGALCFSCSGQCLMSSFLGGRSGNRGRCAGPCRLPYEVYDERMRRFGSEEETFLLSMKDLCLAERLPDLERAGVCSLKIEGRMKSPLYVAGVTSVYRKILDTLASGKKVPDPEEDRRILRELFDRGGFTDGYLDGKNGREMLTLFEKEEHRIPDRSLTEDLTGRYLEADDRIRICLTGRFEKGKPAVLEAASGNGRFRVRAEGPPVQEAKNSPLTEEGIREKLTALGNTQFKAVSAELTVGQGCFMPVGELKELRRTVCEKLEQCILAGQY